MLLLRRLLEALSVALLVAGATGVLIHHPARSAGAARRPPAAHPTTTRPSVGTRATATTTPSPTTAPAGPPGPATAVLEGGLIVPQDMGGYYSLDASAAATFLDSAPCLAALQPSPAQNGRAVTALLNRQDAASVPEIYEEVASYPGSDGHSVFSAVSAALAACPRFRFEFNGAVIAAPLATTSIPPVGDSDQAWTAGFTAGGASYQLQIGVVLDGRQVLVVAWIDTSAGSDPIMGNFASTLSLAIGKLA